MKTYNIINAIKNSMCVFDEGQYSCDYEYDGKGNIVKLVFNGAINKVQEFLYDKDDNVVTVTEKDNNFITTTNYVYKDTPSGKVISSHTTKREKIEVVDVKPTDNK